MTIKVLIGSGILVIMSISLYLLFPGLILRVAMKMARFSARLRLRKIRAGGYRWVYLDGGKGETVLFIHGFGGSKDTWGRMLGIFSEGYRVIAPDLLGTNDSGIVEGEYFTISKVADELENFALALNLESFHMVGISSGGALAAYYAAKNPDRLKSISLIGPFGIQTEVITDFRIACESGENPIVCRNSEGFDLWMSYIAHKPVRIPSRIKCRIAKKVFPSYDYNIKTFNNVIEIEGWDMLRKHLKNIMCPVLVIFGDKDRVTDVSCVEVFRNEIINLLSYIMQDAGHITYLDKPGETIKLVHDFVCSCSCG